MDLSQRLAKLTPEQRALLEARLRDRRDTSRPLIDVIQPRSGTAPSPLSFAQERLWFLEKLEGVSATYNIAFAYRLRGELKVDGLERALAEIVRRHESLRTTFPAQASSHMPEQRITDGNAFHLQLADLSAENQETQDRTIRKNIDELCRKPMALAKGPLFVAHLYTCGRTEHVFALAIHHMVSDGWSFGVFFRELATLYTDFVAGREASLPELALQYADYASWQREQLTGPRLAGHLDYWKKKLEGIPPLLELPTDHSRPREQAYQGSFCERTLDPDLTQRVLQLTRELDATPFMTILAAFQTLLFRYAKQTDILVGSPVTSRNRVELEPLIGFFVNMLPLRANFAGAPTVRELIQQVRQTTLEALSHQELPFEMLVRELRPERSLGHAPLFQVSFMFQQEQESTLELPNVSVEALPVDTGTAKFDLTLFASETKNGFRLWMEYSTILFTAETANRMLEHLVGLMTSMVATPDKKVTQLTLLSAQGREQILSAWNRSEADYPRDKTVHALFVEQVQRTPQAIAVEFENHHLTYRELDKRTDALAAELRAKGVKLETAVGIYVERSIDMLVAVLGILKAGGFYVPLDPAFPPDRLAFMVADAAMPVLVTQTRLVNELPQHQSQVVCVDAISNSTAVESSAVQVQPQNLAYTLYTSGSTGKPKGVQLPHQAVVNFLYSMRKEPGARPDDRWLAITTLSFDIAGLELFLPLITGARVVIASRAETLDANLLMKRLIASKVTAMQATPATWRMLLDANWPGDAKLKILCGGEALDPELADRLLARCGELWNMYGPTETTIWSTTERVLPGKAITIGHAIANTQVYILDENFEPTPPGVIGELFLGGDGVARGYLNRPELTQEKFMPNPFLPPGQARMYRTGDLARFLSDGRIVFLGRTDHQVKIRGFRIEIGEIETALNTIKGVVQTVVVAREDTPGDKRLVAYVVPEQTAAPVAEEGKPAAMATGISVATLRTQLRASMPEYMVPTLFVFLESLPLTPNGKVDRKALPRPADSAPIETAYEAPQGETEEKLAVIMATLLKVPRVGRKDDFFTLGGHSLLAVTFFNEVEKAFGKQIPLATLFRAPTLQALATVLSSDKDQPRNWSSLVPIQTNGKSPNFFCVHGAGGNVLLYRDLIRTLGPNYVFYGLQSRGLDKTSAPLRTIEDMAEHYLSEIRAVQSTGPYCIGGYCLGGIIAYEMAQRLTRAGETVSLLALFDTYNTFGVKGANPIKYLWQKIRFHTGNIAGLSLKDYPGYISNKLRVASDGEFLSLMSSLTAPFRRDSGPKPIASVEKNVQKINDAAADAYRPRPYTGKVTVFKPKVNYDFLPDPKMGWGEMVTGQLEIVEMPVNPHAMLIDPFVKRLATELKQRLDDLRPDPHGGEAEAFSASG